MFIPWFNKMQKYVHEISKSKGWQPNNDGEQIALMHSELSEALEALRVGNPPSEKTPDFTCVEEELADVVIRVMNYSELRGLRLAEAIVAKTLYNESREKMHGGKLF